jgi:hypothetical protein
MAAVLSNPKADKNVTNMAENLTSTFIGRRAVCGKYFVLRRKEISFSA